MKSEKWYRAVCKPRPKHVREAVSKAQKGRKHQPNEGFQKGHVVFGGVETRFKKGQISINKGKKCPWAEKHGFANTPFYRRWQAMKQRCENSAVKQYKDYGGRGIKIEWQSFEQFQKDMCGSYQTHLQKHGGRQTRIERIDNDGNYSKENCRWATCKEQMRNRRNNHMITFKGKTLCITDWAKELGITYNSLWKRMQKKSFEEIVTCVGYEV